MGGAQGVILVFILYILYSSLLRTVPVYHYTVRTHVCSVVAVVGLVLIAVGTGGIKPCVSAFGGDQFQLPLQEKMLNQFFSIFYFW